VRAMAIISPSDSLMMFFLILILPSKFDHPSMNEHARKSGQRPPDVERRMVSGCG